ncbi:histidine utilization repressor [Shewanella intestini]|uniref:Histidine utilization repressor n=1 Tax=Shewanella intestini TaxID=2017544 RepID=A0ABS5I4I1_9GAMM|nr:histidine utilization repressor [Shewanella sp. XMDDZSB0408]MBR9728609.1 histidine utilization repressor [Shewanella intestini]MRG37335.1 histidine utilization repressor [Shewanella sp. XMDDZSB0408]
MTLAKYAEIKDFIVSQIQLGAWKEHAQVPSENQLSDMFTCSRMTSRRALTELVDAGVLTRAQGMGTFVAEFKSQSSLLTIRNIADEIKQRGHGYHAQCIELAEINAQASIAIALGVPVGRGVYHSLLVHFEQNVPLQLEERFVNPVFIPDYLQQDFTQQTPHEYLSKVAPLTEARHTVEAIIPSACEQQYLAIAATEPCLLVSRRTWSSQGAVSFARLVHPGSKFRLGGHLTFT